VKFDAQEGLVMIMSEVFGPRGVAVLRLAVDTGATTTVIRKDTMALLGYVPNRSERYVRLATGSGEVSAPIVEIRSIEALGVLKQHFSVVCHTMPGSTALDGVLGFDFMRGRTLTVDFRAADVTLV